MTEFLVGGYGADGGGEATGISRARSHPDGRFEWLGVVAETASPSWLTVAGGRVFAALEPSSVLEAYEWVDGALALVDSAAAGGELPCHLALDGGQLITACYGDGAVAVADAGAGLALRQVLPGTGSGPLPAQEGPHAHHVLVLADVVLTADLGADLLHVHTRHGDELVRTDSVPLPAGTGPRDLLALPDGRVAVLGEWSCELLLLEPRGATFEVVQILALPGATPGDDQAAALGLSADGRHVVAGIRGADRIAAVALADDAASAAGWTSTRGTWPRHLVVDGGFVHVANQLSSTVTTFRWADDGTFTPVGDPVPVPSPTCLAALAG